MKTVPIFLFLAAAHAEDWTTTDGKTYQDVKVTKIEADCVTVLDSDGGARIDLAKLPPDIQKKLGYDPAKAKAASDQRAQDDSTNMAALEAERNQAESMKKASQISDAEKMEAAQGVKPPEVSGYPMYIQITQVLPNGILADPLEADTELEGVHFGNNGGVAVGSTSYSLSGKTIFIQVKSDGLAEDERYTVKATRNGTFQYQDTTGATRTVEKWIAVN
jgi:hypothetical protein